ncbi:MAG TPA: PEP-CTERM sorting domain-containing protein [Methylomirabilota bacterium]|jgi:hypothetical protein
MKLLLVLLLVLIPFSQASAIPVTSNPLWTNTGISVLTTDTVSFTGASASWTYQFDPGPPILGHAPFGPEGVAVVGSGFINDEWIQNGLHGQLIGFIGSVPDLNASPRAINQGDSGLFPIGAGPASVTGKVGTLWLGFNDGYVTATNDNVGSGSVNVTVNAAGGPEGFEASDPDLAPTPEPATLLLLGTTAGGLALARWRRSRQARQES